MKCSPEGAATCWCVGPFVLGGNAMLACPTASGSGVDGADAAGVVTSSRSSNPPRPVSAVEDVTGMIKAGGGGAISMGWQSVELGVAIAVSSASGST